MPAIMLALKIIGIAEQAFSAGKNIADALAPIKHKLDQVHAEGRDLTPTEFEELEATIASKSEELHR